MKKLACAQSPFVHRLTVSALSLFVLGIGTLNAHHSSAANYFAFIADLLDGRSYLHHSLTGNPESRMKKQYSGFWILLIAVDNSSPGQIHTETPRPVSVARQDANEILPHSEFRIQDILDSDF